jgi:hypothetical protein
VNGNQFFNFFSGNPKQKKAGRLHRCNRPNKRTTTHVFSVPYATPVVSGAAAPARAVPVLSCQRLCCLET